MAPPDERLRLRSSIDAVPSWIPGRPGIVLRDPFQYADGMRLLSESALPLLAALDGSRTRAQILRRFGAYGAGALLESLEEGGFLAGPRFEALKAERHRAFAEAAVREPQHAGGGYPASPDELRATLDGYRALAGPRPARRASLGIAAPHLSPFGAPKAYGAAYAELGPELRDKTFVLVGTSHYGAPDRFGLTAKPFATPLGLARTDAELAKRLHDAAPEAVVWEDYCHAIEHSLEFQVVFLQHAVAPDVRILPILCGPIGAAPGEPRDPAVGRFLSALEALAARDDLYWILGIDLAHVGPRYGHRLEVEADRGPMNEVAATDRARLELVCNGDRERFLAAAHPAEDTLNWCGTSPLVTFLSAVPAARGRVLEYAQWNIDPSSVVSCAGLGFERA